MIKKGWNIEWVDGETYKSFKDGCPKCGTKNLSPLPDIKSIPRKEKGDRVNVKQWDCFGCKTHILDTKIEEY